MKEGGRNEERNVAIYWSVHVPDGSEGTISPRCCIALRDDSARLKRMRRKLFNARDTRDEWGPGK